MIGKVLGHYRVVAKIGEGGMGIVYRGHDDVLHRDVALKVVKKDVRLDPSASQNLLREARASSALAHPNICTIHEVGETDGELYIVMELVQVPNKYPEFGQCVHKIVMHPQRPERLFLQNQRKDVGEDT